MNALEDLSLLMAAFAAALFGQGGGVLYTPLQVWNGVDLHTAAPVSLLLILVISLSSTLVFRKAHQVDWSTALILEVPTTLGAFLGGVLSQYVSSRTLGLLLFILLGTAAWFMLRPPKGNLQPRIVSHPSHWIWQHNMNGETYQLDLRLMIPVMLTVGVLTSMVGIGGGALKVPLMVLLFGIPMPIASFNWTAALLLAIPVFIGGQIGSRLSIHLDALHLEKWFGYFILVVAFVSAFRMEVFQ
jgi:uncharacterized membrane protein YfcA